VPNISSPAGSAGETQYLRCLTREGTGEGRQPFFSADADCVGGENCKEITMRCHHFLSSAAVAGMAGLLFCAIPASAQEYGAYGPPTEEVIVTAPPPPAFQEEYSGRQSLTMPPEKVSLSQAVRYDDLDLRTGQGAHELRRRVVHAARAVCGTLREAYPFHQLTSAQRCYPEAMRSGLVRANEAISDARESYAYGYGYETY
jgi:UrcA family protein